jgi:hypothetical protein
MFGLAAGVWEELDRLGSIALRRHGLEVGEAVTLRSSGNCWAIVQLLLRLQGAAFYGINKVAALATIQEGCSSVTCACLCGSKQLNSGASMQRCKCRVLDLQKMLLLFC